MAYTKTPSGEATHELYCKDVVCTVNEELHKHAGDEVIIVLGANKPSNFKDWKKPQVVEVQSLIETKITQNGNKIPKRYNVSTKHLTPIRKKWNIKVQTSAVQQYVPKDDDGNVIFTDKDKNTVPIALGSNEHEMRVVETTNIQMLMENIAPSEKWQATLY